MDRDLRIENKGFSIIELLVTLGIIIAITTLILWNYQNFSARSVLRTRTVDIITLIRLAQAYSTTTYLSEDRISTTTDDYLFGFDSVRIRVREGKLYSYQIESTDSIFTSYAETFSPHNLSNNKETVQLGTAQECPRDGGEISSRNELLSQYELDEGGQYAVRYCLLGDFKQDKVQNINNPQSLNPGNPEGEIVCARDGSPYEIGFDLTTLNTKGKIEKNVNFDIHISFERPTAEPFAAVVWPESCPVTGSSCVDCYGGDSEVIPSRNPRDFIVSNNHETIENIYGIRIFLINEDDNNSFRYFDVLETGLITLRVPDAR